MPAPRARSGLLAAALAAAIVPAPARGADDAPATLREGFESPKASWQQEETDVTVSLLAHERSERAAHEGRRSERFRFRAQAGSAFYYSYRLPRIPITDDLETTLYVRSNQSGVQLLGRVVLPADLDPETRQPTFVLVQGSMSDQPNRWQKLELKSLPAAVEQQVRALRFSTKRPIDVEGAYLDRLVVNLYGGPGEADVFLDDLTITPVPGSAVAEAANPPMPGASTPPRPETGPGESRPGPGIAFDGNRLKKDGRDWVPAIVRAPGADLAELRRLGLDVLAVDLNTSPETIAEATRLGFRLMPRIDDPDAGDPRDPAAILAEADAFPAREAVAFWDLGDGLGSGRDLAARKAQRARVRALMKGLRDAKDGASRPLAATVFDEFKIYAQAGRNLDLMGVRIGAWGTVQEPFDTYRYLLQRRDLTSVDNPQGFFFAWVPAATPPALREAIWGRDVPPAWGDPQVQPEQVRMYAFAALMAGYRGLGYLGDAGLTRAPGHARRLEIGLLQLELGLIESIIAEGQDPITLMDTFGPDPKPKITYNPTGIGGGIGSRSQVQKIPETPPLPGVKAAMIATQDGFGRLLIVNDFAGAAQWQPPQMAMNDVNIIAQVPESSPTWEVSLGDVTMMNPDQNQRLPGGRRITIREFGGTALVLATSDLALVERLRAEVYRVRPLACAMAIEQARLQYDGVAEIHGRLALMGRDLTDPDKPERTTREAEAFLARARETIRSADEALRREDYEVAWAEARRVGRWLRTLMRVHWNQVFTEFDKAAKESLDLADPLPSPTASIRSRIRKDRPALIVSPVGCPPIVALNTLPQAYLWTEWIKQWGFGANLVPSGSFDGKGTLESSGWSIDAGHEFDKVHTQIVRERGKGWDKKDAIQLKVYARKADLDHLPPFFEAPAVAVRTPPVRVQAAQLLRIRVKVKMPRPVPAGNGGLIVRDSLGGELLQYRLNNPLPEWREVVLFRRAPADGELTVTLGLAGFGEAFFDDLRIERAELPPGESPPVARRPEPRREAAARPPSPRLPR